MFIQQERAYITDDDQLRNEVAELQDRVDEMESYFEKQCDIILLACESAVIKEVRSLSRTGTGIKFLGDDYDELTFFDQLCAVARYGNTECYPTAIMYIEECCGSVLESLSKDEKFALSNTSNQFFNPMFTLKGNVIRFFADYSNKRIDKYAQHLV